MTSARHVATRTGGRAKKGGKKRGAPSGHGRWFVALIVAVGGAAYANSFSGAFVLDDLHHIINNERIRHLWPVSDIVLRSRRPVVNLTLAVNYAISGLDVWSYHAVNVAVHLLAAVTLFGLIRRTLLLPRLGTWGPGAAARGAAAIALIWVVHPLGTQSVTYLIQRGESMMGLFYLLTLYCVIRGAGVSHPHRWYVAAVASCALGMGSKAVMVTAPVVVLLYDRLFLSGSWRELLRRRFGLYVGLAASCSLLAVFGVVQGVLDPTRANASVGFACPDVTPHEYALTQPGVVLHYLRLSVWPHRLCLDYDWNVARRALPIVVPAAVIGGLLLATLWALKRVGSAPADRSHPNGLSNGPHGGPYLGFCGVWFFVILAPTSSFIPIKDPAFEHRMYLSLAAVVVLVVIGGHWALEYLARSLAWTATRRRIVAGGLVGVTVMTLGCLTLRRNHTYQSESAMWADVVEQRPRNVRAHYNLGTALRKEERTAEAIQSFLEAIRLDPAYLDARTNLCVALAILRRFDEGEAQCREALRIAPAHFLARYNLGSMLGNQGRLEEAAVELRAAVQGDLTRVQPRELASARFNLGVVLEKLGAFDEAVVQYREALRVIPEYTLARRALDTFDQRRARPRQGAGTP